MLLFGARLCRSILKQDKVRKTMAHRQTTQTAEPNRSSQIPTLTQHTCCVK